MPRTGRRPLVRDLKAAGCSDVFRKALSSVFDWITGKASTSKGEASRGLTSVGEGDDGVDLQNRLDGLRRGRAEGVRSAKRADKIEVGMDVAVRCRVTDTWQDDLGDQWAVVLIEGYDLPITLKVTHFYSVDERRLVGCRRNLRPVSAETPCDAFISPR